MIYKPPIGRPLAVLTTTASPRRSSGAVVASGGRFGKASLPICRPGGGVAHEGEVIAEVHREAGGGVDAGVRQQACDDHVHDPLLF
jgi:hypothetical protein